MIVHNYFNTHPYLYGGFIFVPFFYFFGILDFKRVGRERE